MSSGNALPFRISIQMALPVKLLQSASLFQLSPVCVCVRVCIRVCACVCVFRAVAWCVGRLFWEANGVI